MVTLLSENCSDTLLYIRGFKTFGFHPHEIGNKSIRSDHNGSLSHGPLLQNYDPWPLVLGCISGLHSTPVLEWTNNMSCDMIHLDSFFDAPHRDLVAPDDPRTASDSSVLQWPDNIVTIPKFYIHH
jgi:hypothetical protein